jgi:hypothetical protein
MEQKGETLIHELHMHTLAFDVQLTNPEFWPFVEPTYESLQRTFAFNFANLRVPSKNAKQQLIERVNSISSKTKVCFAEKEFCSSGYVARRGEVFHPKKVFFKIMCLAACHVNVTILYHLGAIKHMCTGFAADLDAKRWIHHSWGLDDNKNIVETTFKCQPDVYFGVILTDTPTFQLPEVVGSLKLQYDFDSDEAKEFKRRQKK